MKMMDIQSMPIKNTINLHMKTYAKYVVLFLIAIILFGCSSKKTSFEILDFNPLVNYTDTAITLDYKGAIENGFVVPTIKQISGGEFELNFSVKNKNKSQKLYYKLYYQNESYKFPDNDSLAIENFYGSWEDVNKTFVEIPNITTEQTLVKDKFRIVGNPLNDSIYFGEMDERIDTIAVAKIIKQIKGNVEWYKAIQDKAKQNNILLDKQIAIDAEYVYRDNNKSKTKNNRWKRNLRTGKYSFLLVVCTAEAIKKIPSYIQNVSLKSGGRYVNPYYYFFHGKGALHDDVVVVKSNRHLNINAKIDFSAGIYIDKKRFEGREYNETAFRKECNTTEELYKNAQIEQFIHDVDNNTKFNNVPLVADVTGAEYTKLNYLNNGNNSPKINVPIQITNCPCATVGIDSIKKAVVIKNPGTKNGEWRKENVGIITRHGFTYGKYRLKVKLTELLNKHNVWNGITNAIWMYRQNGGDWNYRRDCPGKGYVPKDRYGNDAPRVERNSYSEIDIEIVKAARHWPKTSYKDGKKPAEVAADSNNIMVTATNWDLACQIPEKFDIGVFPIKYKEQEFPLHRWDTWYQAVTTKFPASDDELFKADYYWFEIEWKPQEIIWRMGPEKSNMKVFGYMNDKVTYIPNNQMLLVVTQEWHHADWWPEAPFNQNQIPFPAKDIPGYIYEMEVE